MKTPLFLIILSVSLANLPPIAEAKQPRKISNAQRFDPTCPIDNFRVPEKGCFTPSLELSEIKCPADLSEDDCDFFKRGYGAAREDRHIMGELMKKDWKDDSDTEPAFKQGYEVGWRAK